MRFAERKKLINSSDISDPLCDKNDNETDAGDLIEKLAEYIAYWPWFLVSFFCCLCVAYLYLNTVMPMYKITAKILIKDGNKGGSFASEVSSLEQMGFMDVTSSFDNELEVLRSESLIKQAVFDMKGYCRYSVKGLFADDNLNDFSPVLVDMYAKENENLQWPIVMEIRQYPDSSISVSGICYGNSELTFHGRLLKLPGVINTPSGRLRFSFNPGIAPIYGNSIHVTVFPAMDLADEYASRLEVSPTSKTTSVAELSFTDSNKRRGEKFLNALFAAYNRDANSDKNIVGLKTDQFITERLDIIFGELGLTERELENYKRDAGLTDLTHDFQLYFQENSEYEQKRIEIGTQINLINYLNGYIRNPDNAESVIPANVGLKDLSLTTLINAYNEKLIERNRLLRTSLSGNPVIQNLNTDIVALHAGILSSLASVRKGLLITLEDFEKQGNVYAGRISNAPEQERTLTNMARQQEIKSGLYLTLLQKREENSIRMAANVDNAKVIDAARARKGPISPKTNLVYLIACVLGLVIPIGALYVIDLFRYKIADLSDVKRLTHIPVLGEIPLYKHSGERKDFLVVKENENDFMSEAFRRLRTDLGFLLSPQEKVLLFASTTMGEGKTFISTNLAMSLALLNKKVVLVGLDIRRPRLAEHFGFSTQVAGITSYLSYGTDDLLSLLQSTPHSANLKILPAGKVPPNPGELLAGGRLQQAIDILRQEFDYVLIDTSPVSVISDTLIAGRIADLTVYVCRVGVTHKKAFRFINSLHSEQKLPHIAMAVNAVNLKKYNHGYYGYGYGPYNTIN